MGLTVLIIWIILSFWILHKTQFKSGLSRNFLWMTWAFKILFSISFILIFTYTFGNGQLYGDAANFFNDGKILADLGRKNFGDYLNVLIGLDSDNPSLIANELAGTKIWSAGDNGDQINDNRLIIKLNSIIHFISFSNVYLHALLFSFLSFIGLIFIYKTFKKHILRLKLFFLFIVLFPSIGFWSSGITKEAIMLFAIGIFLFNLFRLLEKPKNYLTWSLLILATALLLMNKPYVGLILVSSSLIILSGKFSQWNRKLLITWPVIIFSISILLSYTPSSINLVDKTSYKQRDLINVGKGGVFFITDSSFCDFDFKYMDHFEKIGDSKIKVIQRTEGVYKLFGESKFHPFEIHPSKKEYELYLTMMPSKSYIDVTPINYSGIQLIKNIPESLINSGIRPFPNDPGSKFKYLIFIQNLLFIAFIGIVLFNRRKLNLEEKYIFRFLLFSALIILLIIGWTTPIIGAVVRYKVGAELLIITALFILFKSKKIQNET